MRLKILTLNLQTGHDQEGRRGLNEVVPGTSVFPFAQARAASRPGLCAIAPGRRAGAPPLCQPRRKSYWEM